jgi:hypothetical protein
MGKDAVSTRRAFVKVGAVLAAPLAAAAPVAVLAADARKTRLEDQAEIARLHQAWLRRINMGAHEDAAQLFADPRRARLDEIVRSVLPDHTGEEDSVELAADGLSAKARYACAVEVESALEPDCTLAQMARAQGGGFIRRTERRMLKAEYIKADGAWAIARLELSPAS